MDKPSEPLMFVWQALELQREEEAKPVRDKAKRSTFRFHISFPVFHLAFCLSEYRSRNALRFRKQYPLKDKNTSVSKNMAAHLRPDFFWI